MKSRFTSWSAWLALIISILAFWGSYFHTGVPLWGASVQQNSSQFLAVTQQVDQISAISPSFNYQGILRDANGQLLSGGYTMTLKIYSSTIGGSSLFMQTTSNVNVRDGIFNVVLGNISGNPLDTTVFASSPRYLGIAIAPDAEMSPRQEIHAVPWALMASQAITADTALVANIAITANTATVALTANKAITANTALVANIAITASTATVALTANKAITANTALVANTAITASTATVALTANKAITANTALVANTAITASTAMVALTANKAITANTAAIADQAMNANSALTATNALSANVALSVPDGSITTSKLADGAVTAEKTNRVLKSGSICLQSDTEITAIGNYARVKIPTMSLTVNLDNPATLLVWSSGQNRYLPVDGGYSGSAIYLDETEITMSARIHEVSSWFDFALIKLIPVSTGIHTVDFRTYALGTGKMIYTAGSCLQYVVLD